MVLGANVFSMFSYFQENPPDISYRKKNKMGLIYPVHKGLWVHGLMYFLFHIKNPAFYM